MPRRLEFSSLTSDQCREKRRREAKERMEKKKRNTRSGKSDKVLHPGDLNITSGVNGPRSSNGT